MAARILQESAGSPGFSLGKFVDANRFWSFVAKGDPKECWDWQGAKDSMGYGRFHISASRNSTALAHRVAFGLAYGKEPPAVCHRCDNPSCCNPAHMFGGTWADNNLDMTIKGRNKVPRLPLRGQGHHQAKLTDAQAIEIRSAYSAGGVTQRQLAAIYGVCQRSISKVVRGISFKNAKNKQADAQAGEVC
ncbi:HNH endonuclease signature motif containing protein [Bordetella hinzii]|uniref:HNH endonuclease signature motif containing protein n=1 Tax=Bordetella hinzii TaxID=103855 RepID=UPI0009B85BAF